MNPLERDEKGTKEVEISLIRTDLGEIERKRDLVAVEEPLHIFINQKHYITILCTPTNKTELVLGHLISEGLVKSPKEVRDIRIANGGKCNVFLKPDIDVQARLNASTPFSRLILTSCGSPNYWPISKLVDRLKIPRIDSKIKVKAGLILEASKHLSTLTSTFRKTGGVHAAALISINGQILALVEDVGRHNAVDKVIGLAIGRNSDFQNNILLSTGRLTGDIVLKAARIQIPIVASLASAIYSGIEIAKMTGVTLVGFVRGHRMNVYTYPERVVF